jgi:hypothetical protein
MESSSISRSSLIILTSVPYLDSLSFLILGIDNVETFFGTAPVIWNRLFAAMANLVPQSALKNVDLMNKFALFSLPMVRLVDMLVGCTNGNNCCQCY